MTSTSISLAKTNSGGPKTQVRGVQQKAASPVRRRSGALNDLNADKCLVE